MAMHIFPPFVPLTRIHTHTKKTINEMEAHGKGYKPLGYGKTAAAATIPWK